MGKNDTRRKGKVFDSCPHCGQKLSPWQQVLLGVDRALMCRNCWYRILLDVYEEDQHDQPDDQKHNPEN